MNELARDPIMLSADRRVTVRYDMFPELPEVDGFGTFATHPNSRYVTLPAGYDNDTTDALREVFDYRYDVADDEVVARLEEVLTGRGVVFVRRTFTTHRDVVGEYFVWATFPDATTDHVNAFCREVQMFCDGDVYVVAVEKRVIYRNEDDPGDVVVQWHVEDAVAGVYFDCFDDAAVLEVADVHV